MKLRLTFILLFNIFRRGTLKNYDNEIIMDPEIMCLEKSVGISIKTKNPYFGRIFVNGLSDSPECSRQFNNQYTAGKFEIPFSVCDMRVNRILSPYPGMEYTTTVIVSFHTELLTQTDRAFNIKCRYYQTDQQSIGSFFEVSVLPTVVLTSSFPMPSCRYTLHVNSIDGPEAQFTRIGDAVYHRWTCESSMYGIKVKSCFVDDGRKRRYQLVDAAGCASDLMILPDITYDPSLQAAYVQTNVFKFADRAHVFFQCQITLCLKDQQACTGITPPNCNLRRTKRMAAMLNEKNSSVLFNGTEDDEGIRESSAHNYMDIVSPSLVVLDIGDERKFEAYVSTKGVGHCDICLATFSFAGLIACNVLTLTIATITATALCRRPAPFRIKT